MEKQKEQRLLKATESAIRAVCMTDPTIGQAQINAAIAALRGDGVAAPIAADRAISRKEAARLLGVIPHTISDYVRKGLIRPFRFGAQGKIAHGYSLASVNALLEGRATV